MRHAISSSEEIWVRVCAKFFERHGEYNWYKVDQNQALVEMLKDANGQANPYDLRHRIHNLYKEVGIKDG